MEFFFTDWNKALRKLFLRIGDKFANKFDKNVSKTIFRNNQLPFFTFHTLFFYKHKAYRSWILGLTFSISQKLKDLSNIFVYQKNKLVLNKILSIKHSMHSLPLFCWGVGGWTSHQIFKKERGGLTGPQLWEGDCWKRGGNFSQRGCNFTKKKN